MRQRVTHNAELDFATPKEIAQLLEMLRNGDNKVSRVRATSTQQLDGTGSGILDVYKVPVGAEFAARRVSFNLSTASDPSTGNVVLNVAGKYIKYTRSGIFTAYAMPQAPNGSFQVPGVESWGDQQGPTLRNGEVFELQIVGLTASASLTVEVQGLVVGPKVDNE